MVVSCTEYEPRLRSAVNKQCPRCPMHSSDPTVNKSLDAAQPQDMRRYRIWQKSSFRKSRESCRTRGTESMAMESTGIESTGMESAGISGPTP